MTKVPSLLIVSAFFPPSRKIGARRPERFARHLAERGWDVTVLTVHAGYSPPLDVGWTSPPGVRVIRTHAFMPGNALRHAAKAWQSLRARGDGNENDGNNVHRAASELRTGSVPSRGLRLLRDALWRNLARVEFPDRWIGWKPFALAASRRLSFDAVLATLPPYSIALIARQVARREGAVLALDYRDPWTESPRVGWDPVLYAHLLDRHRQLEDSCLRAADVILATSPTICRWLAPRAGIEPTFAPNSFDQRMDPAPSQSRSRTVVYTGSLAYGRSLAPILSAMSRLTREEDQGIELVYAGSDGDILRADAKRLGLAHMVRDLGYLPAHESERLLRGALAAVVLVTPGYEYMLPGKMFEVLASGTPLLVVAPSDSDAALICQTQRLGWHHALDDIEGIAASLRAALTGQGPVPFDIDELRTDRVIERVDATLREALGRTRRASIFS